ncbi:hypothetical protein AAC387_Pa05g0830 [Persea americana]|eukprot:TRINITY_DN5438_c0_g2_i1.p1 TRINITY_DN5438_c0_g2~~TRINITY_DN5438_c0_g2_i1.p1  ORF type:complete len:138 (-),score=33.17 TRINITY_DN5438_c0_g2_i1:249-662(-)
MAAAIISRLLRKRSPGLRNLTSLNVPPSSDLQIPLFSHRNPDSRTNPDHKIPNHLLGFLDRERISSSQSPSRPHIFPSFPYGCFLNPISPSGFDQSEAEEVEDGPATIWADSVKKKRKRKMNKHKYKKLRKRLRRKT